jgi:hypothetical protein
MSKNKTNKKQENITKARMDENAKKGFLNAES